MERLKLSFECPGCSIKHEVDVPLWGDSFSPETRVEVLVQRTWNRFLVWNLFGRPKYDFPGNGGQRWYDPRHEHVEFEKINQTQGVAYFAVQVADSIDGDKWLLARVPVKYGRLKFSEMDYTYADAPNLSKIKGKQGGTECVRLKKP